MNPKKILYTILAAWIALYLFGMVSFLVEDAAGHENGHAKGIYHLEKGEITNERKRIRTYR